MISAAMGLKVSIQQPLSRAPDRSRCLIDGVFIKLLYLFEINRVYHLAHFIPSVPGF